MVELILEYQCGTNIYACESGLVTYRKYGEQAQTTVTVDEFVSMLVKANKERL